MRMPIAVRLAVYLSVAGILGGVLFGILGAPPLPVPPEGMEDAFRVGAAFGTVLGIGANAFALWLIWKAFLGRNWARILLLAGTVVGIAAYLSSLEVVWRTHRMGGIPELLCAICGVIGAALFFVPSSNRWFRRAPVSQRETNVAGT